MELFKTPDQALLFALRFSSQQYPQSPMARQMKRSGPSSGKGLNALDGAAQAGLIKSRMERLSPLERACIVARYSARTEECQCCGNQKALDEYKEAIIALADWALQFLSNSDSARRARYAIVRDYFERKLSGRRLAEEAGVPHRTAHDQKSKIWPQLAALDKQALAAIDDQLAGLCGEQAA